MKQADVKIGGVYLTKIGERDERVVVVEQIEDLISGRTRWRVRRDIPGSSVLPKSRFHTALREAPPGYLL